MKTNVRIGARTIVGLSLVTAAVVFAVVKSDHAAAPAAPATASDRPSSTPRLVTAIHGSRLAGVQAASSSGPEVSTAVKFDVSPPLSSIAALLPVSPQNKADDDGGSPVGNPGHSPDPVVQGSSGKGVFGPNIPSPGLTFVGLSNLCGCSPPDPNAAVSANYIVEMVNLHFQIFSKAGAALTAPASNNSIWTGFGGPCQTENAGDPVVLHDQIADRWLLSQFTATGAPFFNCVAVSMTNNPTGAYYRYAFSTPSFPDYPKYGVWRDAYYLNTRESGIGVLGAIALERDQMLIGNPLARQVRFTVPETATGPNGLLPSDLDGITLPPVGSPNYFVGTQDNDFGAASDALLLYKFHVDWGTTALSTFTGPTVLPIAAFDTNFPCSPTSRDCITQRSTAQKIDILSYRQRPTFRLAYRNFGTHESLVTNQSVEASTGIAGIRWWEIRSPNAVPTVFQEGTYAPGTVDGIHRWMGSIAMDVQGNMGLGYSVSDVNIFPGIRYTGRLVTDPAGTMPQGEGTIVNGAGSQSGSPRWGDYSSMAVDPVDDCTFWYTNEYYTLPNTLSINWSTRIGSFKFPNCNAPTAVKVLRLTARWHGASVDVSWRTGAEVEALGYNLYRSAGTGPSRKVNRTLIAAKQSARGAGYRLVDNAVRHGVAYQYRLQIVDRSGKRSWYSLGSAAS